jgi:hypothetical protein
MSVVYMGIFGGLFRSEGGNKKRRALGERDNKHRDV